MCVFVSMRKSGQSQVVSPHCGFDLPIGKLAVCAWGALFFNTSPPPSSSRRRSTSLSLETGCGRFLRDASHSLNQRALLQAHQPQPLSKLRSLGPHAVVFVLILRPWECAQLAPTPAGRH